MVHRLKRVFGKVINAFRVQDGIERALFDEDWYISRNPDFRLKRQDAYKHFIRTGSVELRSPHPLFDSVFFHERYSQICEERRDILAFFLMSGLAKRLDPHPLFDTDYYIRQCEKLGIPLNINPVLHYLSIGAKEGLNPSPAFSTECYLDKNPDVAAEGENPLVHFIKIGCHEARIGHVLATCSKKSLPITFPARTKAVRIFTSSAGSFYMSEIGDLIAGSLRKCGVETLRSDETEFHVEFPGVDIVVAPHEFFPHASWAAKAFQWPRRGCVVLNTEQLSSAWFERAIPYFHLASKVLDINEGNVEVFRSRNIDAHFLPLSPERESIYYRPVVRLPNNGLTDSFNARIMDFNCSCDAWKDRPIDVLFMGMITPRRANILRHLTAELQQYQIVLVCSDRSRAMSAGSESPYQVSTSLGLAQRSKIILNIHHGTDRYFPPHRLVLRGITQGAIVLTESCDATNYLHAAEDYLAVSLEDIPLKIAEILAPENATFFSEFADTAKQKIRNAPLSKNLEELTRCLFS